MSEQHGPAMICATQIMKAGRARIGRVAGVTLTRTVSVVNLFAAGGGALLGIAPAMSVSSGLNALLYGALFGGAAGWFLVTYSPLQGESMLKWLELQLFATRRARYIDGQKVTLAVGGALLPRPPMGKVLLLRSAVRIPSSQYDERGVLLSPANRNVPTDGAIDPVLFAALALPGEPSTLTPGGGRNLAPTSRRPERGPRRRDTPPAAPSTGAAPPPASRVHKPQHLKD